MSDPDQSMDSIREKSAELLIRACDASLAHLKEVGSRSPKRIGKWMLLTAVGASVFAWTKMLDHPWPKWAVWVAVPQFLLLWGGAVGLIIALVAAAAAGAHEPEVRRFREAIINGDRVVAAGMHWVGSRGMVHGGPGGERLATHAVVRIEGQGWTAYLPTVFPTCPASSAELYAATQRVFRLT